MKMSANEIAHAIQLERLHQKQKYGENKEQSLAGYLLIMQKELQEAIDGWMSGVETGRHSPLSEILQVAAVAWACMETYGTEGNTFSTNDINERTIRTTNVHQSYPSGQE